MRDLLLNFAAAMALLMPAAPANAQADGEAVTAPPRAEADLAELGWLVGHWAGTGIEGHPAGESFSWAGDGQIVGHFWQLDGAGNVEFYELITLVPDGESLTLRLKHFTADLTGWEEQAGSDALAFPLRERSDGRWVFGPVTFVTTTPDRLKIEVTMRAQPGSPPETLVFDYRRIPPGG